VSISISTEQTTALFEGGRTPFFRRIYVIEVVKGTHSWAEPKRFSDFDRLNKDLTRLFLRDGFFLKTRFPKRFWLNIKVRTHSEIEERRKGLDTYMKELVQWMNAHPTHPVGKRVGKFLTVAQNVQQPPPYTLWADWKTEVDVEEEVEGQKRERQESAALAIQVSLRQHNARREMLRRRERRAERAAAAAAAAGVYTRLEDFYQAEAAHCIPCMPWIMDAYRDWPMLLFRDLDYAYSTNYSSRAEREEWGNENSRCKCYVTRRVMLLIADVDPTTRDIICDAMKK
jgi:hypothetical protein